MAELGEFGRAVQQVSGESDWFTFHGERFEIPALLSALPTMRFAWRTKVLTTAQAQAEARVRDAGDALATARSPQVAEAAEAALAAAEAEAVQVGLDQLAAMWEFMSACLASEDQWERFYDTAIRAGADAEELMGVCGRIVEVVTARPTGRPSGSSVGPSSAGARSMGGYGSQGPMSGPLPPSTAYPPQYQPEYPPAPVYARHEGDPLVSEPPVLAGQPVGGYAAAGRAVWAPRPMTPLERQKAQFRAQMTSVDAALRSGG